MSAKLSVTFTASCATKGLVDFEVYSGGRQVGQVYVDAVQLSGSQQTVSAQWQVPSSLAAGSYTLKVGVFSSGWSTLYSWSNNAGKIKVS